MTERLSSIEQELRRAVESHRFTEIQRLVLSFCEAAETHIRTLPAGDPRIQEIGSMVLEVLHWCRTMVQSARECLVLQMREIRTVQRYIPAPAPMPAAMHLDV